MNKARAARRWAYRNGFIIRYVFVLNSGREGEPGGSCRGVFRTLHDAKRRARATGLIRGFETWDYTPGVWVCPSPWSRRARGDNGAYFVIERHELFSIPMWPAVFMLGAILFMVIGTVVHRW